uniref:histidinol-phosphatase n=1 Tax=uncultured organism TaxID=155900 RepID=M1Q2L6_9ZZZZ|nr:histidinol phosphate phosphatase HisJ family [uncultured organism]
MYLIDYHTHPYAHGGEEVNPPHNLELLQNFIKTGEKMGLRELGFSDHDRFLDKFNWSNLKYIRRMSKSLEIRLGIEFDYQPHKEEAIAEKINSFPFDYCIGSVHFVDDWEVDHPDNRDKYRKLDIDVLYKKYLENVKNAVNSDLFDIIGHVDLIKIFNYRPAGLEVLGLVEPILKSIKKMGLALEINTNGLNKPINEIYPSRKILERAYELNIPLTLGSDAHRANRVGEKLPSMINLITDIGYKKLATFNNREMKVVSI